MSTIFPIAYFDPPHVFDASITPIPAASALPIQVIADTGIVRGSGFMCSDGTNQFIGVYVGPVGQETLVCIVGNGVTDTAWGHFPPNSRVSLRAMANVAITSGLLTGAVVTS